MAPDAILSALWAEGLTVTLAANDALAVSPASILRDAHRALLRTNKVGIVDLLRVAHDNTQQLLAAAMRACDHHGDGPAAREEMRQSVLETPGHLRADLLEHLQQAYPLVWRNAFTVAIQPSPAALRTEPA